MTQRSDAHSKKTLPPEIDSLEDVPFDLDPADNAISGVANTQPKDTSLSKEKNAKESMDTRKFMLGSTTLGWCIFLMFLCIIISLWAPENELVKSGFETFKLIIMTILGYIFGSNHNKPD